MNSPKFLIYLLSFILLLPLSVFSQGKNYWKAPSEKQKARISNSPSKISDYQIMNLDVENFKKQVKKSPLRHKTTNSQIALAFPFPNGDMKSFTLFQTQTMSPKLAAKFPSISSYVGVSLDKKYKLRLTLTKKGVYGMISGGRGLIFINPTSSTKSAYKIFNRKKITEAMKSMQCQVLNPENTSPENQPFAQRPLVNDKILRTYRLAIATTGEYAQFHIARAGLTNGSITQKKAAVLAAINVTMDRVNGVYERAIAVNMQLVANEENLIFLNGTTDPFTNNNSNLLIDESQKVIDNIIGFNNYDIGHTFSTGGGGLAYRGSVCTSNKAKGITGMYAPVGDAYNIDYVCHEMGHQFGASHTFNNACDGNQTKLTAMEPGSGVTIMGYAGICPPNIAPHSIPFFHAVSIAQIHGFLTSTWGGCASETALKNTPPNITPIPNYIIPHGTAFVLTGEATDPNGDVLTYTWDQMDNEIATMPPSPTSTQGPSFRSFPATNSPIRHFPQKSYVLDGNLQPTWQVVPSVARQMRFRLTVRDNNVGGGQTAYEDINIRFTEAGPFKVVSQNTSVTWKAGENKVVSWAVANTNQAPISTEKVNILLSTDGGLNFDVILAENVPNDGTQIITVPKGISETNKARVKVEAVGNIFYAVNASPFSIEKTSFVMKFVRLEESLCQPDQAVYAFTYQTSGSFSGTTTFSTENLPSGLNVTFNPSTASTDGTSVQMTVSNTSAINIGTHSFYAVGTSGSAVEKTKVQLNVYKQGLPKVVLTAPTNNKTSVSLHPELTWESISNIASYELQIATDSNFNTLIGTFSTAINAYAISSSLFPSTTYYWRVRGKNTCSTGSFSDVFSFTTAECHYCMSEGTTDYQTGITKVVFKTINKQSPQKTAGYNDYTHISTTVDRGTTYDLSIYVNTAGSVSTETKVWIDWNQNCRFDDPGEMYNLGTATNTSNGITSYSPLAITIPSNASTGETTMRISTQYTGDFSNPLTPCRTDFDGEVEDYTLNIGSFGNKAEDATFSKFSFWPNPNKGQLNIRLDSSSEQDIEITVFDIRGRRVYSEKFENTGIFTQSINLHNLGTGLYLLKVNDGTHETVKKIVLQ